MSEKPKPKIPIGAYPILAWMAINFLFMVLELTVLSDAADLNKSVELVLRAGSIAGLASMRKWGVALAIFIFCCAMSTSISMPQTTSTTKVTTMPVIQRIS